MSDVLTRLLRQAYLFDDPMAYQAGVRDAFAALGADPEEASRPTTEGDPELRPGVLERTG